MQEFYKIIEPIKDKCLGLIIGNHEEKYIKFNHFDVYDYLANELIGNGKLKLGKNGFVSIVLGKYTRRMVSIFVTHGEGLSSSPDDGSVMTSMLKLCSDKEADVYIAGHVHRLIETTTQSIGINNGGKIVELTKSYVIGGAWLKKYHIGTSGYFESKRGNDTIPGYVRINFSLSNHSHKLKTIPTKILL